MNKLFLILSLIGYSLACITVNIKYNTPVLLIKDMVLEKDTFWLEIIVRTLLETSLLRSKALLHKKQPSNLYLDIYFKTI